MPSRSVLVLRSCKTSVCPVPGCPLGNVHAQLARALYRLPREERRWRQVRVRRRNLRARTTAAVGLFLSDLECDRNGECQAVQASHPSALRATWRWVGCAGRLALSDGAAAATQGRGKLARTRMRAW